jgi:hypothetical protein
MLLFVVVVMLIVVLILLLSITIHLNKQEVLECKWNEDCENRCCNFCEGCGWRCEESHNDCNDYRVR